MAPKICLPRCWTFALNNLGFEERNVILVLVERELPRTFTTFMDVFLWMSCIALHSTERHLHRPYGVALASQPKRSTRQTVDAAPHYWPSLPAVVLPISPYGKYGLALGARQPVVHHAPDGSIILQCELIGLVQSNATLPWLVVVVGSWEVPNSPRTPYGTLASWT